MPDNVMINGLGQAIKSMQELSELMSPKSRASPLLPALRAAGKVVQRYAKAIVRKKSRALEKNIIVTRVKKSRLPTGSTEAVEVTVRYKATKYVNNRANRSSGRVGKEYADYGPLFYGRIIEFGSSKARAYPFLRPAFDTNASSLPEIIRDALSVSIEAAVAKMRKR